MGRERELAEVGQLLRERRVVTLAGPAGCGKTRLAVELARGQLAEHPDGTWFVDLVLLTGPGLVAGAVADTVGLAPTAQPDLVTLVRALDKQCALLILDNCEHLVEEVAELADSFARGCPPLQILITSREPVGAEAEWIYRVGPLWEPDAVRLFVARAQQADAAFEVDESNSSHVAAICRRLDGLPLALELAAAHAGSMAPADIFTRLDQRFRLLVDGHTPVARHRSLQAALEWSEALLSESERRLFRRLGVFVGGFDLEAAEAVAGGPDLPERDVVPLLGRLVERSLVTLERSGGAGRYALLETLREHALERLAEAGEATAVRDAHADHYAALTQRLSISRMREDTPTPQISLELLRDFGNCRATLEHLHATASPHFARLVCSMGSIWQVVRIDEWRRWSELALAVGSPDTEQRLRLLLYLGLAAHRQGDVGAFRAYYGEALTICEERSDVVGVARVLGHMSAAEGMAGNAEARLAVAERGLPLAREAAAAGHPRVLALALHNLASALPAGELDRALELAEEGVAVADRIGEPRIRCLTRNVLVNIARRRGDHERALTLARHTLRIELVDPWTQLWTLASMAAALIASGASERGLRLSGAVEGNCGRLGYDLRSVAEAIADVHDQAVRALGRRAVTVRGAGERMSLEEAVAFALEDPRMPLPGMRLSRREVEVALLIRQGLTDPEIAKRLFISTRTAEGHAESLRNKLGIGSRAEVAAWVVENMPGEWPAGARAGIG